MHVAHLAVAVGVEHLDVVEVGVGRDAGGVVGLVVAAAGRDAGDMGAVAEEVGAVDGERVDVRLVVGHRLAARIERGRGVDAGSPVLDAQRGGIADLLEVDRGLDARGLAVEAERVGVVLLDARVEHRDADAGAVQAGVGRGAAVGAHVGGQRAGDRFQRAGGASGQPVRRDTLHVAARGDRRHLIRRQHRRQRGHRDVAKVDRAALGEHVGAQRDQVGVGAVADAPAP